MDTKTLIANNQQAWERCEILPARKHEVMQVANRLVAPAAKQIYQHLEEKTKVPWFIIAIIHERECTQNWHCSLAQGDPWNRVSVHRPRGRGPFHSFEDAAVDALLHCPPYAGRWTDWTPGGALTLTEDYNGTGYENFHHVPSPYVWGATNHQERGKYVSDGKWDGSVWDKQLGCAAMLKGMMELDPSIKFA